jgi:hypothetical protein
VSLHRRYRNLPIPGHWRSRVSSDVGSLVSAAHGRTPDAFRSLSAVHLWPAGYQYSGSCAAAKETFTISNIHRIDLDFRVSHRDED